MLLIQLLNYIIAFAYWGLCLKWVEIALGFPNITVNDTWPSQRITWTISLSTGLTTDYTPSAPFLIIPVFCFYNLKFRLSFLFSVYLDGLLQPQIPFYFLIKPLPLTSLLPSSMTSAFTLKICYYPLNNYTCLTLLPAGPFYCLILRNYLYLHLPYLPHPANMLQTPTGIFYLSLLQPFLRLQPFWLHNIFLSTLSDL